MAMEKHQWNAADVCTVCGLRRNGYGGGRTGRLTYTRIDGSTSAFCGECVMPDYASYQGGWPLIIAQLSAGRGQVPRPTAGLAAQVGPTPRSGASFRVYHSPSST
jgi:hypothetical protein